MKEVYSIQREVNDKGWSYPSCYFDNVGAAVAPMRDYVARSIKDARSKGVPVHRLIVWDDSPTGHLGKLRSQTITFKMGSNFYEYRVFAHRVFDSKVTSTKLIF